MSKPEIDLQPIRQKLLQQKQQQLGAGPPAEARIDWAPPPRELGTAAAGPAMPPDPRLAAVVGKLQERSSQTMPAPVAPSTAAGPDPELLYALKLRQQAQQRIDQLADQINSLSAQQERAMVELKAAAEQLNLAQRRQPRTSSGELLPGFDPLLLDDQQALLAIAEQDEQGNVALTYRPADLHQADREASRLAQSLRDRSQPLRPLRRRSTAPLSFAAAEVSMLLNEPMQAASQLWRLTTDTLRSLWQDSGQGSTARRLRPASFTLVDAIIWLGGGVISRLVLNLVLAAYPGLWFLAVAAVTSLTAYALYQATLAPRLDFNLAYRVLLGVAGLIIGGRLF